MLIGEERRLFALEVELHFKNRLRYEDLFKRYLKTEGLYAVWYVVPSKSMGDRLLYDPRNALLPDHQGEVKISDWRKLDHLHGQASVLKPDPFC